MKSFPQALANGVYRSAATVTGKALLRDEIVHGVYVHRSVAAGEVSFGRSDIDLMVILREPNSETGDAAELASLYRRVCWLRRFNPAAGHIRLYTPAEFEASMCSDTYRGSVTRRNSILLAGKAVAISHAPVRREDAIRRFAYWPDNFFSIAVRERNRRNLRKMATEMWCAYALAQGRITEPYVTRRETVERSIADGDGGRLVDVARHPEQAPEYVLGLAKNLHDELFPPLKPLREPLVFSRPILPRSRHRVVVIVPDGRSAIPAQAFQAHSFFATPELLHLFIHYVNPFFDWMLPDELRQLGFVPPNQRSYARACQFFGGGATTREPGFLHKGMWVPGAAAAMFGHAIEHLKKGAIPPPLPMETLQALGKHEPSCSEYYANEFAGNYRQAKERSRALAALL
jgi:hypothetical protein